MAYTALKPCNFAGNRFKVGEMVPDELVHSGAAKKLVKAGVLASSEEVKNVQKTVTVALEVVPVSVKTAEGTMTLDCTKKGVQDIFSALTSTVADAETVVNAMTDNDALILLHLSDSRKAVKELAQTRAKAIAESGED